MLPAVDPIAFRNKKAGRRPLIQTSLPFVQHRGGGAHAKRQLPLETDPRILNCPPADSNRGVLLRRLRSIPSYPQSPRDISHESRRHRRGAATDLLSLRETALREHGTL